MMNVDEYVMSERQLQQQQAELLAHQQTLTLEMHFAPKALVILLRLICACAWLDKVLELHAVMSSFPEITVLEDSHAILKYFQKSKVWRNVKFKNKGVSRIIKQ